MSVLDAKSGFLDDDIRDVLFQLSHRTHRFLNRCLGIDRVDVICKLMLITHSLDITTETIYDVKGEK